MKTVEYITAYSLSVIPNTIKYFFEGEKGFWDRKNLNSYSRREDSLSKTLKKNDALENSIHQDYSDLISYMDKQQKYYLDSIESCKKTIKDAEISLVEIQEIGSVISGKNTMKENINLLTKT